MSDNDNEFLGKRRPKIKDIDRELVWKMACMQCTLREIADVCNVSHTMIAKHFGELIEKGKSMGKKSLRRAQWDKAINGDARMLVFLGKNYLGQQDSPENNDDNMPLPWDDE
tara:strand:- start:1294 stop:1629 length:336 start_codon:yes stop_codon:yes gene_type:complete